MSAVSDTHSTEVYRNMCLQHGQTLANRAKPEFSATEVAACMSWTHRGGRQNGPP
jgi:hypothetical protein